MTLIGSAGFDISEGCVCVCGGVEPDERSPSGKMHPLTHGALTEEEDHSGENEAFLSSTPPLRACFLCPSSLSRSCFLAVFPVPKLSLSLYLAPADPRPSSRPLSAVVSGPERHCERRERGDPADEGLASRTWHRCEGCFCETGRGGVAIG